MSTASVDVPPQPSRLHITVHTEDDTLHVFYRPRQYVGGCFLLVWISGWTVACGFLLHNAWNNPNLVNVLFGIPFWAAWVFTFFTLIASFTTRHDLFLNQSEFRLVRSSAIWRSNRHYPLNDCVSFTTQLKRKGRNDQTEFYCIRLKTNGQPVEFGDTLPKAEQDWLAWKLNQVLQSLKAASPPVDSQSESKDRSSSLPSDSDWCYIEGTAEPTFRERGQFSPAAIGGALFFCLFWNGILSIFLVQLWGGRGMQGIGWWGLFFFLIPFEVIGLVVLLLLITVLLEPLRRTTWTFEPDQITKRTRFLEIGPTKHWSIPGATRLITRQNPKSKKTIQIGNTEEILWELVVISSENGEICALRGLTQGEAAWIKGRLEQEWKPAM